MGRRNLDTMTAEEKAQCIKKMLTDKAKAASREALENNYISRFEWAGETDEELNQVILEIEGGLWEVED